MRSDFPVGSTRWAVRRAQWAALGIGDEAGRPKVAVVNSSSGLSVCYSHLDALARDVAEAIRDAGGLPFEIRTTAPSDFVTSAGRSGRYLMPARDLIVNDIEVVVEGAQLDGMVCLSSCDKTTPAHLMAAARLDIPTILVIGGYQTGGMLGGRPVDIDDVYEAVGSAAVGTLTSDELGRMADAAICGPGVCAGLGTANSMHIVAEALGMTLPGSAPVRAGSTRMTDLGREAGRRIVAMVREDLRPRSIITDRSIANAVTVMQAVGGSVNTVRHLAAVATEAGLACDVVRLFETTFAHVPMLCRVRPNGPHSTGDLESAGGTRAIMAELAGLIDGTCLTVSGMEMGRIPRSVPDEGRTVIRAIAAPVAEHGSIQVLRGTLAPDGALVKRSALPEGVSIFAGDARIFGAEDEALSALSRGDIHDGDVVILRGLGPRGGPGTGFAAGFAAALNGAGMLGRVAVITDGELSGLNRGLVVGQVMPEAADGGPLGVVREGERVEIDPERGRLDVIVDGAALEKRLAEEPYVLGPAPNGWLRIYRSMVGPLARGAVLGDVAAPGARP